MELLVLGLLGLWTGTCELQRLLLLGACNAKGAGHLAGAVLLLLGHGEAWRWVLVVV